jgi:hypothetical protein
LRIRGVGKSSKLQAIAVNETRKLLLVHHQLALPMVLKNTSPYNCSNSKKVKSLAVKCFPNALCPSALFFQLDLKYLELFFKQTL